MEEPHRVVNNRKEPIVVQHFRDSDLAALWHSGLARLVIGGREIRPGLHNVEFYVYEQSDQQNAVDSCSPESDDEWDD